MKNDSIILLSIADRVLAEDIKRILEESDIYSILESDNPASSILNIYAGPHVIENIKIIVNKNDHKKACELVKNSQYNDLLKED